MKLPKLVILDRDQTLVFASSDGESPLYYLTKIEQLVLKPGAREAVKLIEAHGIPMVLATKQRCIGKNIVSRHMVGVLNERIRRMLDVSFVGTYIEEMAEDKTALYQAILKDYSLKPLDVVLFDDSAAERGAAAKLGIPSFDGLNLLESVKELFHIP